MKSPKTVDGFLEAIDAFIKANATDLTLARALRQAIALRDCLPK